MATLESKLQKYREEWINRPLMRPVIERQAKAIQNAINIRDKDGKLKFNN